MRTYTIQRICGAPDWSSVPRLSVDKHLWLPSEQIAMTAQLCYDETAIYVRMQAVEQNIRAEHNVPLSQVCEDSCMEFFFSPEGDERYMNVEMNPNCCALLGIGTCRADRVRIVPKKAETLNACSERTPDGWILSYQLPLSFLRVLFPAFALKPGAVLRANCYKCGDLTENPHYLSWNAGESPEPDFHRPCDFGMMTLA